MAADDEVVGNELDEEGRPIDDGLDAEGKPRAARAAAIREEDIEPYTALRWVSTLFKAAAVFLVVALVGESIAGLKVAGTQAIPLLLGEMARTVVFIVVLWGAGDLVRLMIDLGHDIRAQRDLLARLAYRVRHSGDATVRHENEGPEVPAVPPRRT